VNIRRLSDLQPGDHFIEKFFVNDLVVFVYGFLEGLTPAGGFAGYLQYNSDVPLDGRVLSDAQHEFVGLISQRAYSFAQRQGWPNDEDGVARVLQYSERPR
jgi:hypothetical protein